MLNKLILSAVLSLSLAFSFVGTANAALISQEIISDSQGVIGSVSIETNMADDWGMVTDWVSFEFFGYDMAKPSNYFVAIIDTMDLYAGIQSLDFDELDTCGGCEWAYNGFVEAGFNTGAVDVFNATGGIIAFFDDVSFGQATVVPTPATLVLFLTAIAGLASRRRNS